MTLANGTHYLAIPGPSVMPDAVLRAMHRPAPNIYTGELHEITHSIVPDLKKIARTEHNVAMYICNGHGVWEASLANTMSRGDLTLALTTGRFGHGWADMAERMGVRVERLDFGRRAPVDLAQLEDRLKADTTHEIKTLLTVQVDTSTSVKNDIQGIRAVLDRVKHPALLLVDSIACLGCDRFEMDEWGADVCITGSQKGLMTPPGMAFVFFNAKADAVRENADLVTHYWDWRPRINAQELYQYFCGTAPTHHLFGLRTALDMILEEGIENVWARHASLANAIWAAFDHWGQGGPLELNITDPAYRSHAVTSIRMVGTPTGTDLRTWLTANAGITLGIGLGMATDEDPESTGFFRVGHMGHVNTQMVMGVLGSIATGLTALNIPHQPGGLEAAVAVLAKG